MLPVVTDLNVVAIATNITDIVTEGHTDHNIDTATTQ